MLSLELEGRLAGKDANGQYLESLSYILASPNGEFRHVFKHFANQPEVRTRLAERIDAETGLMQPSYFQSRVRDEIGAIERYGQKTGKPLPSTFVLFKPEDTEKAKEYIKANNQAGTSMIGISDGMVMAFLPCDINTANEIMKDYKAVCIPYEPGMTCETLLKDALRNLIALQVKEDISPLIIKYFSAKKEVNE